MKNENHSLQDQLINFTVKIYELEKGIPLSRSGNILAKQLVRSGTSSAIFSGKACADISRKECRCVMKDILTELQETLICLIIIKRSKIHPSLNLVCELIKENKELIAIIENKAHLPQHLNHDHIYFNSDKSN